MYIDTPSKGTYTRVVMIPDDIVNQLRKYQNADYKDTLYGIYNAILYNEFSTDNKYIVEPQLPTEARDVDPIYSPCTVY